MARPVGISKQELIGIADSFFMEKGIRATEMKDIALKAGIGRSSLYRYFSSKESLAFKVSERVLLELRGALEGETDPGKTGAEELLSLLEKMAAYLSSHPREMRFLDEFDQLFSDDYPPLEEAADYVRFNSGENAAFLLKAVKKGAADGSLALSASPEFTAMLLSNTLLGAAQRVVPRERILRREQGFGMEYLTELPALLVRALRKEG